MKYKQKCLDYIENIEMVNTKVLDTLKQAVVTNNVSQLQSCIDLLTQNDRGNIEYLKNLMELEEDRPF
tara:strand:+ start:87 stop:290 length:204 start_codon:yes stop_codon:yes gene_type:complete